MLSNQNYSTFHGPSKYYLGKNIALMLKTWYILTLNEGRCKQQCRL